MKILEKGHIADVALENYSLDQLTEPDLEVVEEHILICPTCQDRLQQIDDFVRAFRMAHARVDAEGPGGTQIVGDGWITEPAATVFAPNPAWFQHPTVWAGLALAVLLLALLPVVRPNRPREANLATNSVRPVIQLVAQRGAESVNQAPAGRLALQLDLRGIDGNPLLVEVQTWNGTSVWRGTIGSIEASATVEPAVDFRAGQYWIRVHTAQDSVLLREFSLKVR